MDDEGKNDFPVISIEDGDDHGFGSDFGGLAPDGGKADQTRGGRSRFKRVSGEQISTDLKRIVSAVEPETLFNQNTKGVSLAEIKINIGMTASGELGFLVAKGDVKASASIELVFKK